MGNECNNRGRNWKPVGNHTPHASNNITTPHNAIMAVDASDEAVLVNHEDALTTVYLAQGVIYPVNCKRVNAVGTTATSIALFA